MPKMCYFWSKIRQVLGNPLLLDSVGLGGGGTASYRPRRCYP